MYGAFCKYYETLPVYARQTVDRSFSGDFFIFHVLPDYLATSGVNLLLLYCY